MFTNENNVALKLGYSGDEVVLIDFMTPVGELSKIEDIRQIITYGEMGQKYNNDPYTHYEINWNKKHQQILADEGCNGFDGLLSQYWIHSEHQNLLEEANTLHLRYLSEGWLQSLPILRQVDCLPVDLGQVLECPYFTENGTVYCQIKDDHFPDELNAESPHLIWVESDCSWGGCGYSEGSLAEEELEEKLFPLLDLAGKPSVLALTEALEQHIYEINAKTILVADSNLHSRIPSFGLTGYCQSTCASQINDDLFDQCESAIAWLNSLRSGVTDEADLQTVHWIQKWL